MCKQATALRTAYACDNRTQAAWRTLCEFEQRLSSPNQHAEQAAVDGGAMKRVLSNLKSTAQFLMVEYLRFWGGGFAAPITHGVCA